MAAVNTRRFARHAWRSDDSFRFVTNTRALNGPVGIVGTGYIGHLFAQQFALAG